MLVSLLPLLYNFCLNNFSNTFFIPLGEILHLYHIHIPRLLFKGYYSKVTIQTVQGVRALAKEKGIADCNGNQEGIMLKYILRL